MIAKRELRHKARSLAPRWTVCSAPDIVQIVPVRAGVQSCSPFKLITSACRLGFFCGHRRGGLGKHGLRGVGLRNLRADYHGVEQVDGVFSGLLMN